MNLPSVAELQTRYATACDLKQTVDRQKITSALREWGVQIGAPHDTKISFIGSSKDITRDARDARDAWAARDARDAWAARDAWDARAARAARDARDARDARAARAAWDAWDAWDAWAARDASFDVSWIAVTAIGAVSVGDEAQARIWLPILEAFEAGAFAFWVTDAEVFVSTIPAKVVVDDHRRLHCADGPAFVWLDDIADYYWRGTYIPDKWIEQPESLTAKIALSTQNIEQRRAACEIIGWSKILRDLKAKTIDADDDPQIGELVEVELPDLPNKAKFLRVRCGTGRDFAIGIPPHINRVLDAQAWCVGLEPKDFIQPECRA